MMAPLLLSQVAEFINASSDANSASLKTSKAPLNATLVGADLEFLLVTTDTRAIQPGDLFVALRGERFDAHDFLSAAAERGACALVVEQHQPAIQLPQLIVSDTLLALGQIAALNRRAFSGQLIAITGSSGKTTVKTMLASILRECGPTLATEGNLNNHIGVPLTLLRLSAEHQFAVIEMGASGLGEIDYLCQLAKPGIALINNVMPAHVAGFGSVDNIAQAKGEIYSGLQAGGVAVVNIDDVYAQQWLKQLHGQNVMRVSLHNKDADVYAQHPQIESESVQFELSLKNRAINIRMHALGEHNIRNALVAAACGFAAGATHEQIQQGLEKFSPVAGRMTSHTGYAGARVIDDSYNANPGSVRAAIQVLAAQSAHTILVLGDMAELGADAEALHVEVGEFAREQGVQSLMSVGMLSRHASEAFGVNAHHFAQQDQLIAQLKSIVTAKSTILIKGSRSAKTDLIVKALCELSDSTGEQH